MKLIIVLSTLLAVAVARPNDLAAQEVVAILRSDIVPPAADGSYSFDIETADGIVRSEAGAGTGPDGAVEVQGSVSFTHPDDTPFELSFIADSNGYQPESSALPVAPAFPHPIPQFVLDQIAFAAEEDKGRELDAARGDFIE